MNKIISKYQIQIYGLDDKQYVFELDGGDEFFKAFEQDLLTNGQFKAIVTLNKSASMLVLKFDIKGSSPQICDRSLEPYDEVFTINEQYIYKFGDHAEVLTDEIEIIPVGSTEINIAQHLFDFISLAIPFKRIHPKYRNEEEDDDDSEFRLVYSDVVDEPTDEDGNSNEEIDPRWEALKKLKKN